MKQSMDLGRKHGFLLLLLVGSCLLLLLAMFYSQPQAFWLRNLNWTKMEQPYMPQNVTMTVPRYTNTDPTNESRTDVTLDDTGGRVEEAIETKPICDFSDWRSDICNMTGDVRTQGYNSSTVFFVPPPNTFLAKEQQWSVNAYSQKMYMYNSKNVIVKQLSSPQNAPLCTVHQSNTTAILISFGGPTGNIWHDFTDVIIPLFLASRPLNRDIINFDEDKEVRCYRHLSVGLLNHKDFSIDPKRAFDGFNMFKFRMYIRSIYSLAMDLDIPYKMDQHPYKKPRLMLMVRSKTRRFLNQEEITEVIKKSGFELVQIEPKKNDNLTELSKLVDSCDVVMGVHGAALTNILFLRTNALMLQVIPLGGSGMDFFANACYDEPADDMRVRRIDYHITPEESSLLDKYGWDDPVINDPEAIIRKGWNYRQKYYWNEQDVRLNVTRFEPVLVKALELLKE